METKTQFPHKAAVVAKNWLHCKKMKFTNAQMIEEKNTRLDGGGFFLLRDGGLYIQVIPCNCYHAFIEMQKRFALTRE